MADTTPIKNVIEPFVCQWLSKQFPGHVFREKDVVLPTGAPYNFDAVSEDGSIVGAILCNRPATRTGRVNSGAVLKALADINYLKLLPADVKKLMIFADVGCCELIRRRTARLGTESITWVVCILPPNLEKLRLEVLAKASNEQRAAE